MRHHFANDKALASWGRFRDGSVIVDERVHARLDSLGVWQEDGLAHVAVMRKDAKAHADTGGWYFNIFTTHDTATRHHARAGQGALFRCLPQGAGSARLRVQRPASLRVKLAST